MASTVGMVLLWSTVVTVILRWHAYHAVYGWIAALAALAGLVGVIGSLDAEIGFLTVVGFFGFLVGVVALSTAMIAAGQAATDAEDTTRAAAGSGDTSSH